MNNGHWVLLALIIPLIAGGLVVYIVFRPMLALRHNLRKDGHYPVYMRLAHSLSGIGLDLLKVGVFVIAYSGSCNLGFTRHFTGNALQPRECRFVYQR